MGNPLMIPHQLASGDLIRYGATRSRWHFGIVREVDGDPSNWSSSGETAKHVPLEQVTLFRDFLDRCVGRVLSLEADGLCEAFFGKPALPIAGSERFRTMKRGGASKHGIGFPPAELAHARKRGSRSGETE